MTPDARLSEQIANDARLQAVRLGIDFEAELRESRPLAVIYAAYKRDAELALLEFAEADLGDHRVIMDLQARVYRSVKAIRTIEAVRQSAAAAETDLLAEQMSERAEHE